MLIASKNIEQKTNIRFVWIIFSRKAKKLCKKFKLDTNNAELRHFQLVIIFLRILNNRKYFFFSRDGEFHKVYDRALVAKVLIQYFSFYLMIMLIY